MTDQVNQESYPVPDPTVVEPCPTTVRNGQCAPDGFTNHHHQQARTPTEPESFTMGQEMKITDSVEGEGNLKHAETYILKCIGGGGLGRWDGYFYPCEVFLVCFHLNYV